jgi:hypothetical protein
MPHSSSEVIRGIMTTKNTAAELAMEETEHEMCLKKQFRRFKEHEERAKHVAAMEAELKAAEREAAEAKEGYYADKAINEGTGKQGRRKA